MVTKTKGQRRLSQCYGAHKSRFEQGYWAACMENALRVAYISSFRAASSASVREVVGRIRGMRTRICLPLIFVFLLAVLQRVRAEDKLHQFRDVLQANCLDCHVGEEAAGRLNLTEMVDASFSPKAELLEDLIDALEEESMPPEDGSPLAESTRQQILLELQDEFEAKVSMLPVPKTPVRRMNRFQYNNSVQDLFQLNVDVFALPERMLREYNYYDPASKRMPDSVRVGSRPLGKSQLIDKRLAGVTPFPQDLRAENGFDNRADLLSLSPLLMESFLKLGRSIVESPDFNSQTVGIWDSFFVESTGAEASQEEAVRQRLKPFLDRAFRGACSPQSLSRYVDFALAQIEGGSTFETAMKDVAAAIISSPRFLYLYDASDPQLALASRLSFFLWGSLPDDELLNVARSGSLAHKETLRYQVDRMLDDRRSKRFCDSFPAQWMQLERIISSVPNRQVFPKFYFAKFRVSMHMMLEPLLVFETILVENRPIQELIHSDFSYRSELLQSWYTNNGQLGRTTPTAYPFKRVAIEDARQGGVITTAATMTMTSGPEETKPITRGAWIASVILNDPPEPPPADVPPLPKAEADENLTMRERFAAHRDQEACAGCHREIDPLGFALENYDPVGHWRSTYENGREIDASGVMWRKHHFKNIEEFKAILLTEESRFATAFTRHLLSFALGRELLAVDRPEVAQIVAASSQSKYQLRDLIKLIATSDSFINAQ